jgi:hypothetical protein
VGDEEKCFITATQATESLSVKNVSPTSHASAEIVFDVKLTKPELSVDSHQLLSIFNRTDLR